MKLPHVVVFSMIGMTVASLSVLVFTSPRQASQNDLTSNELEPIDMPSASPAPKLSLVLEPGTTAPSIVPLINSSTEPKEKPETFGTLQLTAVGEPCSFFVDGKPVTVDNDLHLMVQTGLHKVKCERSTGDTIERQVDVSEEAITPAFF